MTSSPIPMLIRFAAAALFLLVGVSTLRAQITISPPELYSDINELTITAPNGIRDISVATSGAIESVEGAGPGSCETERKLRVFVNTASSLVELAVRVTDCKGNVQSGTLGLSTPWQLDENNMGTVEVGEKGCHEFQVRLAGSDVILDRIDVDDPRVSLELPTALPIRIPSGYTYRYRVCFDADEIGVYRFPVITQIRRTYPTAGQTSYPVADTGLIRVIPGVETPLTDPTTFRSIAVPNAVIPPKGKLYLGSYDVIGLTGGYSLDDHLMIIAGGAPPFPDDWSGTHGTAFGAWSAGLKIGLRLDEFLGSSVPIALAGGFQHAESFFDEEATVEPDSKIRLNVPYAALSVGDDDRRVSVTGGYAFKHHETRVIYEGTTIVGIEPYDRNAVFVAVGGDWRIGKHWKVTGEALTMETVGVVPVLAGVRYFTNRWAIDGAVAYVGIVSEGTARPRIPLAPVLSFIAVF